ncbi:MAG: hypothetical protein JKY15_06405 [Deltaproteobacteria bacterium]|nr:hypothetical protein [Deltaproteobacteria bacterium]
MKKNSKTLTKAMVTGLLLGSFATPGCSMKSCSGDSTSNSTPQMQMDKNSCSGKDGSGGKDKNSCGGKDGRGGKK